jgi:hypothetical protein
MRANTRAGWGSRSTWNGAPPHHQQQSPAAGSHPGQGGRKTRLENPSCSAAHSRRPKIEVKSLRRMKGHMFQAARQLLYLGSGGGSKCRGRQPAIAFKHACHYSRFAVKTKRTSYLGLECENHFLEQRRLGLLLFRGTSTGAHGACRSRAQLPRQRPWAEAVALVGGGRGGVGAGAGRPLSHHKMQLPNDLKP